MKRSLKSLSFVFVPVNRFTDVYIIRHHIITKKTTLLFKIQLLTLYYCCEDVTFLFAHFHHFARALKFENFTLKGFLRKTTEAYLIYIFKLFEFYSENIENNKKFLRVYVNLVEKNNEKESRRQKYIFVCKYGKRNFSEKA
jgi:hypothetical protein